MYQISIDFASSSLSIETDSQSSTSDFPTTPELRSEILSTLGLRGFSPEKLTIDIEKDTVAMDDGEPDYCLALLFNFDKLCSLLAISAVNISNLLGIVEAAMNGEIPRNAFLVLMEQEMKTAGCNPQVTSYLEELKSQKEKRKGV